MDLVYSIIYLNNSSIMQHEQQEARIRALEEEVERLQAENLRLRDNGTDPLTTPEAAAAVCPRRPPSTSSKEHLTKDEIERYSRQLLLTSGGFGVAGQLQLLSASVLVVGAGGLGSTALPYLCAAGVGTIVLVDYDTVERSNLHRQILHSDVFVGTSKAQSARRAVVALNPTVTCVALEMAVTADNVLELLLQYDIDCVVDASDNPQTRYLLNDACYLVGGVAAAAALESDNHHPKERKIPLVSGSAVGTEGQCTVYHYSNNDDESGCCYRCMYPNMEAQSACKACSDAGVLGPVPGLIGILQAVEVIKILTRTATDKLANGILHDRLLLYDAGNASFLRVKKPPRQTNCALCGDHPTICSMTDSRDSLRHARGPATIAVPTPRDFDVTCQEYQQAAEPHVLLDVRVRAQYEMCALPNSVNIPLDELSDSLDRVRELTANGEKPVYCLCRRGNASIAATEILLANGFANVKNIREGLAAWRRDIDPSFPSY